MDAVTPLNCTAGVLALRFTPVMVTAVPTEPNAGEKPEIVGEIMKFVDEKADPAGVTTRMRPVVAPVGTLADILKLLWTVKLVDGFEPKNTAEAPSRLVPLITTFVPARAELGARLVTEGLPKKFDEVTNTPRGPDTAMDPVSTQAGGWTWRRVSELPIRPTPDCPLNVTFVTPVKCRPVI